MSPSAINQILVINRPWSLHNSSRVRKFTLPIWSQAFLINNSVNLRSCSSGVIENVLALLDLDALLSNYCQKAPVFYVFHTYSFSPYCSLNPTLPIWEVWGCLSVEKTHTFIHTYTQTEEWMSYHISRLSNARQVGNWTDRMKLGMTQTWQTWDGRILHFWPYIWRLRSSTPIIISEV